MLDRLGQAAAQVGRLLGAGAHRDDGELVAALAAADVLLAERLAQRGGDVPERVVACQMAELVVDRLEAVEVEQHEREGIVVAARAGDLGGKLAREHSVVAESGQLVEVGHAQSIGFATGELRLRGAQGAERPHDDAERDEADEPGRDGEQRPRQQRQVGDGDDDERRKRDGTGDQRGAHALRRARSAACDAAAGMLTPASAPSVPEPSYSRGRSVATCSMGPQRHSLVIRARSH